MYTKQMPIGWVCLRVWKQKQALNSSIRLCLNDGKRYFHILRSDMRLCNVQRSTTTLLDIQISFLCAICKRISL